MQTGLVGFGRNKTRSAHVTHLGPADYRCPPVRLVENHRVPGDRHCRLQRHVEQIRADLIAGSK